MSDELTVQELSDQATPSGLKKFLTASVLAHVAQHHPHLALACQQLSPWPLSSRPLRRFYAPPSTGTRGILLEVLGEVTQALGIRIDLNDVSGYTSRRVGPDGAPGVTLGWVDDRHANLMRYALTDSSALVLRHYAQLEGSALQELALEKTWGASPEPVRLRRGPKP
jgi:hypothetical protein